jgi:hypothetical protein
VLESLLLHPARLLDHAGQHALIAVLLARTPVATGVEKSVRQAQTFEHSPALAFSVAVAAGCRCHIPTDSSEIMCQRSEQDSMLNKDMMQTLQTTLKQNDRF